MNIHEMYASPEKKLATLCSGLLGWLLGPKTWIFIHVAKSNEKFLKNPCFSLKMTFYFFFLVNDSQKRLFFPKKRKIGMFFT